MNTTLLIISLIFLSSVISLLILVVLRKKLPLPDGEIIYSDSAQSPGVILQAKTIPLIGKPDYLLKKNDELIPIEIKTGKTPITPYKNHIAQLFAYCLLVEEAFGKRPSYGIIRYPEKEFPLEFPQSAEDSLRSVVEVMLAKKRSKTYRDAMHTICQKCRSGNHT